MKLRAVIEIDVPDEVIFEAYDPAFHDEIRLARDSVLLKQIALDCLHAKCSGGCARLARGRIAVTVEEVQS